MATKKNQRMGEQQIPVSRHITSMPKLITVLGEKAEARSRRWEQMMRPLLNLDPRMSPILIRHLAVLETMRANDTNLLAQLISQLQAGMGQGHYLRALPLHGVDTKFVENYQTLIADLLDSLHDSAVTQQGGLLHWLNCCAIQALVASATIMSAKPAAISQPAFVAAGYSDSRQRAMNNVPGLR